MVARRKARTTQATAQPPQPVASDDDPVARELARLRAMRADVLDWLAVIERRIAESVNNGIQR